MPWSSTGKRTPLTIGMMSASVPEKASEEVRIRSRRYQASRSTKPWIGGYLPAEMKRYGIWAKSSHGAVGLWY